jgi:tetratricopeptide (TPR) repeat protein
MGGMSTGDIESGRDTYAGSNVTQNIIQAPPPTIQSLHQLRAPVADFVGRDAEIERLVQSLSVAASSTAVAISSARGLGGMGKTQLALAVAQRLKDTFPDAQLLVELRGASSNPLTPEQALQTIIRAFEPIAHLPDTLDALRSTYLSLLDGKRILILADDARDARQVEPLLPPPGCALLLTSRQRFPLPGMVARDLDVLAQPQADELLCKICPRIGSAARRMAELCGRLPLALRLCAGICSNSTMSIEYHLNALEAETRLAYMRDPNDPNISVEASLQLSYVALDTQAQQILCQLSVFPSSFDMDAAKAVLQLPEGEEVQGINNDQRPVEDLLDLLYGRSLVEWDEQTERYSLHDLVRVFGLERLKDKEGIRLRYAQAYALIAALADQLYMRGGEHLLVGLNLFDLERANIDAGWKWTLEQAESTTQSIDKLLLDYADATAYVGDLRYDKRRERIPQLEAALGVARRLSDREAEGGILVNLGNAYMDLGELRKAIQHYEQRLQIAQEIGDRRGEGAAVSNMGNAYGALGEPRKAIQYCEQALQIAREIGDRHGEGIALGNIGNAYWALGEPHKAIQYFEQHLQIAGEIGNRQGEGMALGNMGNAYWVLGEPHEAIRYFEQSLEISHEIGDRHGEGSALGNLGSAYGALGEPRKAIQYFEQHLQFAREIGNRQGEGIALGNIGMAYAALGEPRKAIQYFEQHMEITRHVGDRHGEGIALGNMGNAYWALGEPHKAIQYCEQVLAIAREVGDRHGEGIALGNMGNAYAALGEPHKAIHYYQQRLEIAREIGDRRGEAITSWNLGGLLAKEGNLARAVELMQVNVDYEREIGHTDAEEHAAVVEELRKELV